MSEVRRTQVYLEGRVYEALRSEAFHSRRTVSACVRDILAEHFGVRAGRVGARTPVDELLKMSGIFGRGDKPDVAERHDDYLAEAVEQELRDPRKRLR